MVRNREQAAHDSGFGVIEIVISMFLLALLAIAFLPLLITSMRATAASSSIATATQLVNKQMDAARSAGETRALITSFGSASIPIVPPDDRGVSYQPTRLVGPCPATYPNTVSVKVSVSVVGSSITPVTATTLILLKAP